MESVTIQEAQAKLPDLIRWLTPGNEVLITENDQPVAKLIPQAPLGGRPRRRGSAKGKLIIHADDNDHLDDFKEYMP